MHSSINVLFSLALAAGVYAQSQMLKPELSFGHESRISPDNTNIPNFQLLGEPITPQILSNKVILTPPAPGNQRAAIWAEKPLLFSAWEVDVEFRASGPERGGGKFAIFLAKDGKDVVGTSSIYTVGKFEGLALVVDNYAGTGGTIRGFLNDGKVDYKSHHSVDSLAFGHCSYAYRNLGRLSQIKISQDHHNFKVEVDGNVCFESSKIQIPINYNWGVTAVSAETPDSFEINALKVTTHTYNFDAHNEPPSSHEAAQPPHDNPSFLGHAAPMYDPAEIDPSKIPVHEQFADLHNRLHSVHQHITGNQQEFVSTSKAIADQLWAIEQLLRNTPTPPNPMDEIGRLKEKLEAIEVRMQHIQNAVGDTWHIEDLKRTVKEGHGTLLNAAPGLGMLVFIILGSQAMLVAAYVLYKRRKANNPKKYL